MSDLEIVWSDEKRAKLEQRMLSGEDFTYGQLCAAFSNPKDGGRVIDRMIQRFRRKGLISMKRVGRRVIWIATQP